MDKWSGFEAERYRPMQLDEDPQAPAPRFGVDEGAPQAELPTPGDSYLDDDLMDFAALREIVQDAGLQGCDLLDDDVLGWDPMEDDPLADGLPDGGPGIGLWDDSLFESGPQDGGAAEAAPPHEETVRGKGPSGPGPDAPCGRAGGKQAGRAAFSPFGPPEGGSGGRGRDSSTPRADTGGSTPDPVRHGVWATAILEAAAAAADPDSGRGEDTPDWEVRRLVKNLRRFRRSVRLARRTARAVRRGAAAGGRQAAAGGGAQAVHRVTSWLGKAAGRAAGRGAVGGIAAVLSVLLVLIVVLVAVVALPAYLEDKYPPEVLKDAHRYIGRLDAGLEQRILAEADPDIETRYYVNGERIGALRIQTDADELLLCLDGAYNTVGLSEPVAGLFGGDTVMAEIDAIHALLYSYTAETTVDRNAPHLTHIRVIRVTVRPLMDVVRDAAQAEGGIP